MIASYMSETSFAAPTKYITAAKMPCVGGKTSSVAPATAPPMTSMGLRRELTTSRRRRSRFLKFENCSF